LTAAQPATREPMAKTAKKSKAKNTPPKTKKCNGESCNGKRYPIDSFPNSPHTKDGKLNYCRKCWSEIMKKARAKGKARKEAAIANGEVPQKKSRRARKNSVDIANEALAVANSRKDRLLVEAIGQDQKEFKNESKALQYAMNWKLKGATVRIWREVEFQMVLRIVD
jgi:hypothetical protein